MTPLRQRKIESKFIIGLVVATTILGTIFSIGSYVHLRSVLEHEVRDKADLIFMYVDSIQDYVRSTLRPSMYKHFPATFVIESMSSSYISRKVMAPINSSQNGTIYRRVALDARNPDYEANDREAELIEYFRNHPDSQMWRGHIIIDQDDYYVIARPVHFTKDCMYCHGDPQKAPEELLELYGERGFWKTMDSIAGVDFVGASVPKSVGRVEQTILTFFAFFALAALLLFFFTNLLFRLLVVKNLKRLTNLFRKNTHDINDTKLLEQLEQGDEIEELVEGIERLSENLFQARSQLKDYADNLRCMVDEQTAALTIETEERGADVRLFIQLLQDMNNSGSRAELWRCALPQICRRFHARKIVYTCTMNIQGAFVWPESESAEEPPADFIAMLTGSRCVMAGNITYVPVESGSGDTEGLLALHFHDEEDAGKHSPTVLQALGRQLGIAAVNLTAIDSLARQMKILETLVEGISEPLALLDGTGSVLTVNNAARRLTAEFSQGQRGDGNVLALFFTPPQIASLIAEILEAGEPSSREVSAAGQRSFLLALYPVRDTQRTAPQLVIYLRETTKEKNMLAQVSHSEKMATVGKLTAGLAHEINNPLGVILCYTGILRQSINNPAQLEDIAVIEQHTRQAQTVLRELLDFARPKAAAKADAPTDICAVVSSVCEVFAVQSTQKGSTISFTPCTERPMVQLDVGKLEQVVSNLVINALDAVEQGAGRISLRVTSLNPGWVSLEVEDNGAGISSDIANNVFDPFFSTKDVGAGTGLGLTVVYGIVTAAGGRVTVDGSPWLHGARFTVILPAGRSIETVHDNGSGEVIP
jgi:two-component system, NtrC family, sensor kinase